MPIEVNLIKLRSSNWRSVQQSVIKGDNIPKIIEIHEVVKLQKNAILIIPGVGNISALVDELRDKISIVQLRSYIELQKIKVIGICLGYQFLCSRSDEDKFAECLNLFDCVVESIFTPSKPSVGWGKLNVINSKKNANPLSNLLIDKTFYFTHSFGVKVSGFKLKAQDAFSYSPKGSEDLVAAIFNGNIIGFQFHPEKSGQHGISLLSSTINYLAGE